MKIKLPSLIRAALTISVVLSSFSSPGQSYEVRFYPSLTPILPSSANGAVEYTYHWAVWRNATVNRGAIGEGWGVAEDRGSVGYQTVIHRGISEYVHREEWCEPWEVEQNYSCRQTWSDLAEPPQSPIEGPCTDLPGGAEIGEFWYDLHQLGLVKTNEYAGPGWYLRVITPTGLLNWFYNYGTCEALPGVTCHIFVWGWDDFFRMDVHLDQGVTLPFPLPTPGGSGAFGGGTSASEPDPMIPGSTPCTGAFTGVQIDAPISGTTFESSEEINISVQAAAICNRTVDRVEFFAGFTFLGSDSSYPYSFTWQNAPIGTHYLTAKVVDNTGAEFQSFPVLVTVVPRDVIYLASSGNNLISRFDIDGDGSAFFASVQAPQDVVVDSSGNVYTASFYDGTVTKYTPGGQASVFATGLYRPIGLALDSSENLYVAVWGTHTIMKYTPGGQGSVFVNSGLNRPYDLIFDSSDNLYVSNQGDNTIRRITPSSTMTVFANSGLNHVSGLAFDANGDLFAANSANHTIVKFDSNGQPTLFANSQMNNPIGIEFDSAGNLYVANYWGNSVTRFDSSGGNGSVIVGAKHPGFLAIASDGGVDTIYLASSGGGKLLKIPGQNLSETVAQVSAPQGVVVDSSGNIYTARFWANTIEKITPGGQVSTFASGLNRPIGLALDTSGNLFVANFGDHTIRKFTPTGQGSTFVSSGLNKPYGLAFDAAGNLYVSNHGSTSIEKVTPGQTVTTFASSGLSVPSGLAFDNAGNLYVANSGNHTIMKFNSGGQGTVFANTCLDNPIGVAFDSDGYLYVANYYGHNITKFDQYGNGSLLATSGINHPGFLTVNQE